MHDKIRIEIMLVMYAEPRYTYTWAGLDSS